MDFFSVVLRVQASAFDSRIGVDAARVGPYATYNPLPFELEFGVPRSRFDDSSW